MVMKILGYNGDQWLVSGVFNIFLILTSSNVKSQSDLLVLKHILNMMILI